MFGNSKLLFKDLKNLFDFKYYSSAFRIFKKNIKNFFHEKKYQIKNLFEVNLHNGLSYLYSKNYRDARIRFSIMNFIWKNNSCVQYNIGRIYFFLSNFSKARQHLDNAIKFFNSENQKKNKFYNNNLSIFYKKKIDFDKEIFFVPHAIQKEKYEYLIENDIINSSFRLKNLKNLSVIFNHYIWLYKNSNSEIKNLNFLDLGSGLGELGEILREEYKDSKIDGIDFSKKHCISLKQYQDESVFRIYNRIKICEMHDFLFQNTDHLNDHFDEKEKKEKIQEPRFYDVIFSMGTFGEFGQLKTILELCSMNLKKNGMVIFYVYQGSENQLEFNIFQDYFCYNIEYIEYILKNNKNFSIDFIDNKIKIDNKEIILVIAKKNN
jgi:2-polyprenyl-3-methyl-5-hydroxy-6-metoxy-1,4-benzoquinol methylase